MWFCHAATRTHHLCLLPFAAADPLQQERERSSGEHGGKLVAYHDWVSPGTHVPILWLLGQCLAGAVSVVVFAIFKKGLQTSQHNADGEPVVGAGLVAWLVGWCQGFVLLLPFGHLKPNPIVVAHVVCYYRVFHVWHACMISSAISFCGVELWTSHDQSTLLNIAFPSPSIPEIPLKAILCSSREDDIHVQKLVGLLTNWWLAGTIVHRCRDLEAHGWVAVFQGKTLLSFPLTCFSNGTRLHAWKEHVSWIQLVVN